MPKPLYEIAEWDATYECAQSRKEQRNRWVAIPNKHDGRGFNRIALHKKSVELFAAWILIVQVASKMPVRGVLSDKDGPLTAEDLALKTRFPLHIFELALSYFVLPEIGWMRVSGSSGSGLVANSERTGSNPAANSELHDSTLHDTTGHDTTGHKNIAPRSTERNAVPVDLFLTYPCNGPVKEYHLPMSQVNEWSMLYQGVDVASECKKALAWIQANNKKTAKGMPKFLVGWLSRANDKGGRVAQSTVIQASEADAAWGLIVKRLHGTALAEGETLDTPEIQTAIKAMGGSKYLSSLDTNQLPYVKKDFIAAYKQASKQ